MAARCRGKRFVSRKTLELMTADQLSQEVRARNSTGSLLAEGYSFGLGFAVRTNTGLSPSLRDRNPLPKLAHDVDAWAVGIRPVRISTMMSLLGRSGWLTPSGVR
jgi:hypothetical protein